MKKIIVAAIAAIGMFITGCTDTDTVPSAEKIGAVAKVVGTTAGYACEFSTNVEVKTGLITVIDSLVKVVPATDKSFADTWTPVVDAEIQKLVASGKVKQPEADLIKNAISVVTSGIDFVFTKYPKAKEYENLVTATVQGFTDGFKVVVSATDKVASPTMSDDDKKLAEEFTAYLKSQKK